MTDHWWTIVPKVGRKIPLQDNFWDIFGRVKFTYYIKQLTTPAFISNTI